MTSSAREAKYETTKKIAAAKAKKVSFTNQYTIGRIKCRRKEKRLGSGFGAAATTRANVLQTAEKSYVITIEGFRLPVPQSAVPYLQSRFTVSKWDQSRDKKRKQRAQTNKQITKKIYYDVRIGAKLQLGKG
jgi:hypothetical protein